MENETINYLRDLKIPISPRYVRNQILSHPDYPGIISIADVLRDLGLDYVVGQKPASNMSEVPFPYLAHADPTSLLYIKSEKDLEKAKKESLTVSGIIIKIDETPKKAFNYDQKYLRFHFHERLTQRSSLVVICNLILISLISLTGTNHPLVINVTFTASIGLIISLLLKFKEFSYDKSLDKVCKITNEAGCELVIHSKVSKIGGIFKLSDLSIIYFVFLLSCIVIQYLNNSIESQILRVMVMMIIGSIPVLFYSIYSQWKVLKAWCALCLAIDAILLLQISLLLWEYELIFLLNEIHLNQIYLLCLFLLFAFAGVILLISNVQDHLKEIEEENIYHSRVFNSPDVFKNLLQKEQQLIPMESNFDIKIGNSKASNTITLALNPFCTPCRDAYFHALTLMQNFPEKIQITIRFSSVPSEKEYPNLRPEQHLICYWFEIITDKEQGNRDTENLISNWFSMDSDKFQKKYPLQIPVIPSYVTGYIEKINLWIFNNQIHSTPTSFFNGHKLPQAYRLQDLESTLKYFDNE